MKIWVLFVVDSPEWEVYYFEDYQLALESCRNFNDRGKESYIHKDTFVLEKEVLL